MSTRGAFSQTRSYKPPLTQQAHNPPALGSREAKDEFLAAMVEQGGVLKACKEIGISHMAFFRQCLREPGWRAEVDAHQEAARIARANRMLLETDAHIGAHLRDGWEYVRDEETGELVLDDDFEPVKRSVLSVKSLVDIRKEARADITGDNGKIQVAIQNTQNVAVEAPKRPRLVSPGAGQPASPRLSMNPDVVDAEIVAESDQEQP